MEELREGQSEDQVLYPCKSCGKLLKCSQLINEFCFDCEIGTDKYVKKGDLEKF